MRTTRPGSSFGGMMTPGVKALLIANAAVFVLQTLTGGGLSGRPGLLTEYLAFIPQGAIFGLQVWRFFTYMFLHGGLFHIGINMFLLWMFGSQIEARWGMRPFILYYLVCGLGGAVTYGIFNLVGFDSYIPMLGASGAIFGLLLAYGLIFPDAVMAVHLDHGDEQTCYDCIESGFYTSVMIDASAAEFDENVAITKRVVEAAHKKGVVVEAELGKLGGVEEHVSVDEADTKLTDPKQVEEFVERSGCDSLACAIGTSHIEVRRSIGASNATRNPNPMVTAEVPRGSISMASKARVAGPDR